MLWDIFHLQPMKYWPLSLRKSWGNMDTSTCTDSDHPSKWGVLEVLHCLAMTNKVFIKPQIWKIITQIDSILKPLLMQCFDRFWYFILSVWPEHILWMTTLLWAVKLLLSCIWSWTTWIRESLRLAETLSCNGNCILTPSLISPLSNNPSLQLTLFSSHYLNYLCNSHVINLKEDFL